FRAADSGLNAHLFRVAEEEPDLTGVPQPLTGLVRACLEDPVARPTPREIADRTSVEQPGEWLPGTVLAQLGRRAARLLDWAPETPAAEPGAQPDPRVPSVPRRRGPVASPSPSHAPAAPAAARSVPAQSFGPPPAGLPDPAAPHPRRWRGLGVIALTQLLVLLDVMGFTPPCRPSRPISASPTALFVKIRCCS
ncbi:hypothetical protein ACIQOD_31865, partial [Streptomyces sp. NPDC091259]